MGALYSRRRDAAHHGGTPLSAHNLDRRRRAYVPTAVTVATALLAAASIALPASNSVADEPPESIELNSQAADETTSSETGSVPTSDRSALLGRDWSSSEDTVHTVLTGYDGIQVLEARESDGYEWTFLADLPTPPLESDLWVANSCVSSSREHMMVVYAPRSATNDEALFSGGAFAALVDLADGTVEDLGAGYSLAYFNPGCGSGDTAAITRSEPE